MAVYIVIRGTSNIGLEVLLALKTLNFGLGALWVTKAVIVRCLLGSTVLAGARGTVEVIGAWAAAGSEAGSGAGSEADFVAGTGRFISGAGAGAMAGAGVRGDTGEAGIAPCRCA